MNKIAAFLVLAAAVLVIGCGGGGGGGSSSATGTTSTTSTSSTDGTTSGSTGIDTGLTGLVRDLVGNPIQGALVKFYNSGGTKVGQASTNAQGGFAAELPTTTVSFTLNIDNVPSSSNYFGQFTFKSNDYLDDTLTCLAPTPSFTSGHVKSIGDTIVITPRWLGPPNPPTGCLGG